MRLWIETIKNTTRINGFGNFSKREILYHYNKYLLLQSNGYFDKPITSRYQYSGDNINSFLSNTRSLTFEVTERCNLSCDYCVYGKYYTNNRTTRNKDLSIETAINILDYLLEKWSSPLNSSFEKGISIGFYGGEALLNFDFISEIVNYTKKSHLYAEKHINFSMTTNGVVLNKYIPFLVENNFNLLISMDGGTEYNNSYRRFHNNNSAFDVIYKNIIEIKNNYPDYFANNVKFLSVLHNRNSAKEIIDFFQSSFNMVPGISELTTDSLNPDYKQEFWKMYKQTPSVSNSSDSFSNELTSHNESSISFEDLFKFIGSYSGYVKDTYANLLEKPKVKSHLSTGTCKPFTRMIFVTASGKILPCERIDHNYELGKVDENGINLDFDSIAEKINSYFNALYKELCKNCVREFWCNTCLFHTIIGNNNTHCDEFIQYTETDISSFFSKHISEIETNPKLYLQATKYKQI